MRESDFQKEFRADCQLFNCYYEKVPDSFPPPPVTCGRCGNVIRPQMRFTPPKPYDSYLLYNGLFYAIEFKQHKSATAFPYSKITDAQIKKLSEVTDNGGRGYVILNIRLTKDAKTEARNQCYAIDVEAFEQQRKLIMQTRKSIAFDDIKNTWVEIPRIKVVGQLGFHWDIESWLQTHSQVVKVF